ncbi:MAG: polymer-forming cytoskeletal protein [Elusimicrobiota bacterium]|nr:polymer-forming cytoskeletal protein [Elusimicrobiota bacterium]
MKLKTTLLAALLALGAGLAQARPQFNIKIDGKDPIDGPVRVAKGETRDGDIVARGSITVEGMLNGDAVSLDGAIAIPGQVNGDVASLGSAVSITGAVSGDVASMGGPVSVEGRVHGDVAAMGGDVTLGPKAEVNGSVALLGGKLRKADSAKLNGSVTQLDLGMGRDLLRLATKVSRKAAAGTPEERAEVKKGWGRAKVVAGIAFLLGCGLLVALAGAFAPRQVETVAAAVEGDFWRSAGIGLLVLVAAGPALLLLAVSIVGLPLVPVALLAVFAAKLLAVAAFCLVLARRFSQSVSRPAPTTLGGVGLGFALLVSPNLLGKLIALTGLPGGVGGLLLLVSLMLLSFAVMVGVGAIWTTRFGTRGAD